MVPDAVRGLGIDAGRVLRRDIAVKVIHRRFTVDTDGSISIEAGSVYPDLTVTPRHRLGEAAVTWDAVPIRMTLVMAEPAPQVAVEVRDAAGQDLVTAIELLSLANKQGQGRADYLAKRRRLLLSPAHLVEIDLLRSGQRPPMVEPPPLTPYLAIVSRAEHTRVGMRYVMIRYGVIAPDALIE